MSKLIITLMSILFFIGPKPLLPDSKLAKTVRLKVWPRLQNELNDKNLTPGSALQSLPLLQPATADGKPIIQKFTIIFSFNAGVYRYSYKFLPIDRSTL